jgi:peptide/nickel transport system substrate-binding protein
MFLLLLTLILVFTPTHGADARLSRVHPWTTPHILRIADGANALTTLNPHLSSNPPTVNLSEMTMAWLVKWDRNNQPYPELATAVPTRANGGISADGLAITYHLRKSVRWSDGAPFNADDVVFTNDLMNNKANNVVGRFDMISGISEPDKYTVIFHLKKPYSPAIEGFFSSCCANPPILPKHLLAKYPNINDVPYNSLPVGIGPFKYQSWGHSREVVMVANPLYWRGRPKLDKIVYMDIPNRDAVLEQLKKHQIDMWYQFSGTYLPRIQAMTEVSVYRHPSYAFNHFDFNLTHPIVADVRVRQALRLALNRTQLVNTLLHGVGVVQDTATPVAAPYFVDMGATEYDPVRANALLDQAGWARGADGIRAKGGVKLELTFATREGAADLDEQTAFLREQWKQVGVALKVQHYPSALMFAPAQQGGVIYGDKWDVTTFAYAATPTGDYLPYYGCDQFPPAGGNDARWCNQTAQSAMKAFYTHYDPARRKADIQITMSEFVKDVPSIVSLMREDLFAYNSELTNYRPNSLTIFDNMMDVDI